MDTLQGLCRTEYAPLGVQKHRGGSAGLTEAPRGSAGQKCRSDLMHPGVEGLIYKITVYYIGFKKLGDNQYD